jgi:hypothetical protein
MSGEPVKPRGRDAVSSQTGGTLPQASTAEDIAAFVAKARALSPHAPGAKGRLIFALDATMSRQPTWDMACALQADMFREAAAIGSLDIRLVYYRGLNECRATGWISDSAKLAMLMSKIDCRGGAASRAAARGRGLCRRRPRGAVETRQECERCGQADRADEVAARVGDGRHAFCREGDYIPAMTLIAGAIAVITLYLLLQMFRSANPAVLARTIKFGGGVVALAVAAFTGLRGELAVAIPLGIFGAGLLGWTPLANAGFGNIGGLFGGGATRPAGQASRVRSQFLDMRLDHDSGQLAGQIVAGPHAGRDLQEFDLAGLLAMAPAFDAESVALLESYLDRRFPAWRQNAQGDAAGRQRRTAPSGKMTAEEAYQILGLQPGAGRDDISRAHKSLMKKLHPDQGGSTYLAARVNEAKDTLLRTHNG